jgi:serine acetyltransferase
VDAHPGAVLKYGIMLDHATGIVIGEVAAPRPLLLSSSA